jgi:hypothetical protein
MMVEMNSEIKRQILGFLQRLSNEEILSYVEFHLRGGIVAFKNETIEVKFFIPNKDSVTVGYTTRIYGYPQTYPVNTDVSYKKIVENTNILAMIRYNKTKHITDEE